MGCTARQNPVTGGSSVTEFKNIGKTAVIQNGTTATNPNSQSYQLNADGTYTPLQQGTTTETKPTTTTPDNANTEPQTNYSENCGTNGGNVLEQNKETVQQIVDMVGLASTAETGAEALTKMTKEVAKETMELVGKESMKLLKNIGKVGAWSGVALAMTNYGAKNINLGHAILNSAFSLSSFIPYVGPVIAITWSIVDATWGENINKWFE